MKTGPRENVADWGEDQQCRAKYRRFVQGVLACEGAWILVSEDGPLETKILDERWALPLWTTESAAQEFVQLKTLASTFHTEFVPLEELLNQAIPDMIEAGLEIHPDPQVEPIGLLIPPHGLKRNITFVAGLG